MKNPWEGLASRITVYEVTVSELKDEVHNTSKQKTGVIGEILKTNKRELWDRFESNIKL